MKIVYWVTGIVSSILLIASVAVLAFTSHYMKNATFFTVDTSYVDSLTYAPNETFFVEVNYYTNALNNGLTVFEVRMNQYTDVEMGTDGKLTKKVWSHGLQMRGNSWFELHSKSTSQGFFRGYRVDYTIGLTGDYSYYNSFDIGQGWQPYHLVNSPLHAQNEWILDFNGELGAARPQGFQKIDETRSKNLFGMNDIFGRTDVHYLQHDVNYFLINLRNAIASQPWGTGVAVMDLSQYFNAYEYNQNTGKFDRPWKESDSRRMFVNVKFNVSPHGMMIAEQSMFDMVGIDRSFSFDGRQPQRYTKVTSAFTLTTSDFEFVNIGGNDYLGRIKQERIDWLNTFRNISVYVDIDLSHASLGGKNLVGLLKNPFGNLSYVESLVYCSKGLKHTFLIHYDDAVIWSQLQNFYYTPDNITIATWREA
jgi:hypothetical protein